MNGFDLSGRGFRAMAYILISGVIIFSMTIPIKTTEINYWFANTLFVFTASMIARRPGSTNLFVVSIVAILYLLYTDEGIALGAVALVAMAIAIYRLRRFFMNDNFLQEWIYVSVAFALVWIIRNFILMLSFSTHLSTWQLIQSIISFIVMYPPLNFVVQIIFRTRREDLEELR